MGQHALIPEKEKAALHWVGPMELSATDCRPKNGEA
jgi:hypothetical protein